MVLNYFQELRMRDQILYVKKCFDCSQCSVNSQEFWELWVGNYGWRPNVSEKYILVIIMFLINHNITGCFQFVAIKSQRTALSAMEIQRFSAELIKEVTFQWTHSNECSAFGQLTLDYEAWKTLKSMLVSMDSIYQILVVYQSLW